MNRKELSGLLILFFLLLLFPVGAVSQVVVERSKEKVVVSGVSYYIHQVRKGETNYSISRAYNVTEAELVKENPSAAGGPKEGQTLRIPVRPVAAETGTPARQTAAPSARDEGRFIYHITKPGETIYSVSRLYGVTSIDILSSNPGIEVSKLAVGTELAVPRKQPSKPAQAPAQTAAPGADRNTVLLPGQKPGQQDNAYYHRVVKGEPLTSIAGKYGVPLRELRRENRDVRFPQVGEYIRIPGMKRPAYVSEPRVVKDTVRTEISDSVTVPEKPSGFTSVAGLKGTMDIAVLLPFYLPENSRVPSSDTSQTGRRPGQPTHRESWIYPRSLGFIEMYEGILLAADTLSSLGLDISIHTFDIKADTMAVSRLISSGRLDDMDLIIGPAHSANLSRVASWAGKEGIPVVSPVPLMSNSVLEGHPLLYIASPTLDVARDHIVSEMKRYPGHNIILLTDTLGTDDPWVNSFRDRVIQDQGGRINGSGLQIRQIVYFSRSDARRGSGTRLSDALSDKTGNVVILASEDAPILSEALSEIHSLSRKYSIDVYGYPVLRSLENIDHQYLFELDLKVFSPYWIDYSKPDIRRFASAFRKKFLTEPSEQSYAWTGYDVAYYFISGIAIHGKEFLEHPLIHNPELLQTDFNFSRRMQTGGFENQFLYRVRYSTDYEVKLVDDKDVGSEIPPEVPGNPQKN